MDLIKEKNKIKEKKKDNIERVPIKAFFSYIK